MGYTVDAFEGVYDSLHATSLSSQDGGRGEGDETFDFEMPTSIVILFFVLYGDGSVRRRGIVYIPRVPKANQDVS